MTQITGFVAPSRRPGALGIHSIDTFQINVPDLKVAQDFYTAFGLDVREDGNRLALYTKDHPHRWGLIGEGPTKAISHLAFGAYEEDLEPLRRRLQAQGVAQIDPPPGLESNGFWFRDPDNLLIEIRVAVKNTPNEKSSVFNPSTPGGVQGSHGRSKSPKVYPRRLGHILVFTSNISRAVHFYENVVGLRLSDRSGEGIAFMHGIHGSDHHLIALVKSNGTGLHHLSWDVGSFHDVGLGAMQMMDKGYAAGWGVGRHVLGSNYFHYVRDPWDSWCEYSSDIDYIPADHDWASGDHPPDDSFYVWGPNPPSDFAFNYEANR